MNERVWLAIGIRVLGLYLLLTGIAITPNIIYYIESDGVVRNIQIFAASWHAGLYVVFGCLFTFYGKLIAYILGAVDAKSLSERDVSYVQIIQLIGIFLIATSIGPAIKGIIPMLNIGEIMRFDLGAFLSPVANLLVGAILFIKPSLVYKIGSSFREDA